MQTFEPLNDQDLMSEMKLQENRISQHLIERLEKGMKWYIVVEAVFRKSSVTEDGTLQEVTKEHFISSQTFTAFNRHNLDEDLPRAYQDLFVKFDAHEREES